MKLFICGTQGRMSLELRELARSNSHIALIDTPEHACAIIDFTAPQAIHAHLDLAIKHQAAYLVGTTGLTSDHFALLKQASNKIPVLQTSNTSLGANLLFELTHLSSKILSNFKIAIHDIHHLNKKDTPSGTALSLQKAAGRPCEMSSSRIADVIGVHDVIFSGSSETLSLKHEVLDRKVFAEGALMAALFIYGKKPGLYTMQDVLGLKQ